MARWEPDARGRLEQAALELYAERGYEQTTVAEIAQRAGVTERTYFRHFADKREVLFGGAGRLDALLTEAVAELPPSASPLEIVATGLTAAGGPFRERRDRARRRQAVIDLNPSLQERELIKLAALARTLAGVLRDRGVPEPSASIAAEAGVAVFKVAFARWLAADEPPDWAVLVRQLLDDLRALAQNEASMLPEGST